MALYEEAVLLKFSKIVFPTSQDLAPYYHFRIVSGTNDVGHLNLRVGDSQHLQLVVGNVGFGVRKSHRGRGYALLACRALGSFARTVMTEVILTCDPDNHASRKTIERLVGSEEGTKVMVPAHDPHYRRGARTKLRYRWNP